MLRTVANECIVVPVGKEATEFSGILTLNHSGKLLFESLRSPSTHLELVQVLIDNYHVDEALASKDVLMFINLLKERNILEE